MVIRDQRRLFASGNAWQYHVCLIDKLNNFAVIKLDSDFNLFVNLGLNRRRIPRNQRQTYRLGPSRRVVIVVERFTKLKGFVGTKFDDWHISSACSLIMQKCHMTMWLVGTCSAHMCIRKQFTRILGATHPLAICRVFINHFNLNLLCRQKSWTTKQCQSNEKTKKSLESNGLPYAYECNSQRVYKGTMIKKKKFKKRLNSKPFEKIVYFRSEPTFSGSQ